MAPPEKLNANHPEIIIKGSPINLKEELQKKLKRR